MQAQCRGVAAAPPVGVGRSFAPGTGIFSGCARLLPFVLPILPTLVEKPVRGGDGIDEVKWDGNRTQIIIEHGAARLYTRRGHDWTIRYATLRPMH